MAKSVQGLRNRGSHVQFRSSSSVQRMRHGKRARLRLSLEQLESRYLLAAELDSPWAWFQSFDDVKRISPSDLNAETTFAPSTIGPHDRVASEWIVQLSDEAIDSLTSIESINALLDRDPVDFTVISGLGSPGSVLLRGRGVTRADVASVLASNEHVESFSVNSIIQGQATEPNESEFTSGLLPGITDINTPSNIADPTAWDESIGSMSVVVGVVDGGIDATHPDLFLNIWLNQGEIPREFLDDVGPKLNDVDSDGLITFYDLNNLERTATGIVVAHTDLPATFEEMTTATPWKAGVNGILVRDINRNGRIDADDLLNDVDWADGRDTDGNTFFDDFFGVNFRAGGDDPFLENNPSDELGHGTHVAGTIGAVGNNGFGVVGVNWQTSLMSLRILNNANQSDASAAIRAINYAGAMRSIVTFDNQGRLEKGAEVRVLNNSWGQPGGFERAFETAIGSLGDEDILFVAAAGNGNALGNGVDNDETPFFPASYRVDNLIAVAALAADDSLARLSNFGSNSVDLAAPGVGVRSTIPGGGIKSANGTSMAAPHVAGTAALIWSAVPGATSAEVREAILSSARRPENAITGGTSVVATGGKLNAADAIIADVFAPSARLNPVPTITNSGGSSIQFEVVYSHRDGIAVVTIDADDVIVTRGWGTPVEIPVTRVSTDPTSDAETVTATYSMAAPGGSWDPLDFGDYIVSTVAGNVATVGGMQTVADREAGRFNVRITDDLAYHYVDTFADSAGQGSLRDVIITANAAAPNPQTILITSGDYSLSIPHENDLFSVFPDPPRLLFCGASEGPAGWSGESNGDLDVSGSLTIIGSDTDDTVIDAASIDRVFKVHPGGSLQLSRLTVTGGLSPGDQDGGGILSAGDLTLDQTIVRDNVAISPLGCHPIHGGGIAVWEGTANTSRSWITENESDLGGGLFFAADAAGSIEQSTLSENTGGGLHSHSDADLVVNNSTFSRSRGGMGALFNGKRNGFDGLPGENREASFSHDGRFIAITSDAFNQAPFRPRSTMNDILVYDLLTDEFERVNVNSSGVFADSESSQPSLSADGQFVAFTSLGSNLVSDDNNGLADVFLYDRQLDSIERISVGMDDTDSNGISDRPVVSGDGRFVAFSSTASNLVDLDPSDTGTKDVFVYDRQTGTMERISNGKDDSNANGASDSAAMSPDGCFVAFHSSASNLVDDDTNQHTDVFVFDCQTQKTELVDVSSLGTQGNRNSTHAAISADGNLLAFQSALDTGSFLTVADVFVYDRLNSELQIVSAASDGSPGLRSSIKPEISADGRYVSFFSEASNLVIDDPNGSSPDVFVYDLLEESMQRLSENPLGLTLDSLPTISADGRLVAYGTEVSVPDAFGRSYSDVFVVDRDIDETYALSRTTAASSTTQATQVTVAYTAGSEFAVRGSVQLEDVLLSSTGLVIEPDFGTQINVVEPADTGSDLIHPLNRVDGSPPVHGLIRGNPAIDSGSPALAGTVDQLGVTRAVPDVGAVEVVSGSVVGRVFADLNKDQAITAGEASVPEVVVRARDRRDDSIVAVMSSQSDDLGTRFDDETGEIRFDGLLPGDYEFEVEVPAGWRLSQPLIRRIPSFQTLAEDRDPILSADGRFLAFESASSNLVPHDKNGESDVFVYDIHNDQIKRVSVASDGTEGIGKSFRPAFSSDGRFVAFLSAAENLVLDDDNGFVDVFVHNRESGETERVSIATDGTQANNTSIGESAIGYYESSPSLSSNGRFVAFTSSASNLLPDHITGDRNFSDDVFVYDRQNLTIEKVSNRPGGGSANGHSYEPVLSSDGQLVAFTSAASNLDSGDTNGIRDVFVYDRGTGMVERVSVTSDGSQVFAEGSFLNDGSSLPRITPDGRFVTFFTNANLLIPGDSDSFWDLYVYDRDTDPGKVEKISVATDSIAADGHTFEHAISSDGRYVAFESNASNLIDVDPNGDVDTNGDYDVFVRDRHTGTTVRVSVAADGTQGNDVSFQPTFSADGRIIVFKSAASNLVPGDTNEQKDLFVALNPLIAFGVTRTVLEGDQVTDLNLGIVPDPGEISGFLFEDTLPNAIYDSGEPRETIFEDWIVLLDENGNGQQDDGEDFTRVGADGSYRFTGVPSFRNHSVVVMPKSGYEQVAPGVDQDFKWDIFLPPAGNILGRDFGFREIVGTGQSSSNSSLSVRIVDELGTPQPDVFVYLDQADFGTRNSNERADETAAQGTILFDDLTSGVYAVTTRLDDADALIHVGPLGSAITTERTPVLSRKTFAANPQAITLADFNDNGFFDVAVALPESNAIVIRLNDGSGGFTDQVINVDLGAGSGAPTALAVGNFNGLTDGETKLDIAVANNFRSNVMILTDFNGDGFDATRIVAVGTEPLDLAAVTILGDELYQDLVVINQGDNTIQFLKNRYRDNVVDPFNALDAVSSGGVSPSALVIGDFGSGAAFDVAVVHALPSEPTTAFGDVRVLSGDAQGNLSLSVNRYLVQGTPTDIVAANLDGDTGGHLDLAVANSDSSSVSVLVGNGDGSFATQGDDQLLGSAGGIRDLAAADIDNDGDVDIIASNLKDQNVSIFRNRSDTPGATQFEPLESVGQGQFPFARRMPLAVANFDQDRSAPGDLGTVDIVGVVTERVDNTPTPMLRVLKNQLVNGSVRVQLDGINPAPDVIEFVIRPKTLLPSLDPISDPDAIDEDDGEQKIELKGIAKGRQNGRDLRIDPESDNSALTANLRVEEINGKRYVVYTPADNFYGQAVITIDITDAGANAQFDDENDNDLDDDAILTRSFTVTVDPVNDPPSFSIPATFPTIEADQDDPPVVEPNFATGISVGGGPDEAASQMRSGFVLTTDNDDAFDVLPTIDAAGQLTFRPVDDFAGLVTVNVSLSDDGGTDNGGIDQTDKTFVISILPVNDAPSITIGGNQMAQENALPRTEPGFATGFSPGGGADESLQEISDFLVSNDNNALFSVQPNIANNRTLTYTPATVADGTATVTVQVRDSGGTARMGVDVSTPQTFVITVTPIPDTTAPTPLITTDEPSLTNKTSFDVFIDFGEPLVEFLPGDVSAPGATVGTPVDEGNGRYRVPITKPTDGPVTIGVDAGVVTDTSGNANIAATPLNITVDSTALVPSLTTSDPNPTTSGSFDVSIDFSETVTGFNDGDITLINATVSNFADAGGGRYTATINSIADGQVTLFVPSAAAQDAAGNNSLTSALLNVRVDTTPPAPTLSSFLPSLTNQSSFEVEVDFGETVTGFDEQDLTLSSGTVDSVTPLAAGRYRVAVANVADGDFTLGLGAGAAVDDAGNDSLAATNLTRTIDATSPQPLLTTSEPDPSTSATFVLNVDFGESVANFGTDDLSMINASASNLQDDGNGQYRVTITPAADGQVTLIVLAGAAEDDAGNDSTTSAPLSINVDNTPPQPLISSPVGTSTNQSTFDVVVDFGEPVTGFIATDVSAPGATIGMPDDQGNGRYLVSITKPTDGPVTIGVGSTVVTDAAGNANVAGTSLTVTIDSAALIPVVATTEPNLTSNGTFDISVDFGETVTGFIESDLALINATASNFTDAGNGRFTAKLSSIADGQVTFFVPEGAAQDAAGNDSLTSAQRTVEVDTIPPAPVISSLASALSNQSTINVEIDFGESVSGFTSGDVALTSGRVDSLTHLGLGRYLVRVIDVADGTFTLSLAASAAVDDAGNQSLAATDLTRTVDTAAPAAALTTTEPNPTDNTSFTFTVDFGETVAGFVAGDISVTGASITNMNDNGNGRYTATVNTIADGEVSLLVPALAAEDAAGNKTLGSSQLVIDVDTTAPAPTLSSTTSPLTNQSTFNVEIDFGEPVSLFDAGDLTLSSGVADSLTNLGDGLYAVRVNGVADGSFTLGLSAAAAEDDAGNQSLAATNLTRTIDTVAPTTTITTNEQSPTTNGTFDVSIDFGETVSGFVAGDLTLIGAAASNLRDDGSGQYTATINAAADGTVTLIVPAAAVQDEAGNNSTASAPLTIDVDTTSPAPLLRSLSSAVTNQASLDIDIDFGEPVTGFDDTDLTLSSGTLENFSDLGGGRYSARATGVADGSFTLGLAAGAATDVAGNQSLAANDLNRTIDTAAPQPQVSTSESSPTANTTFDVSIDFGKTVNGFAASDLIVFNAAVSNLRDNGNGAYTVTINAAADGTVTLIVPAAAGQDAARNNTLAAMPFTIDVDTTSPAPRLSSLSTALTNQSSFNVEVDFGEVVSGFVASDLTLTSGALENFTDLGGGRYSGRVTGVADGSVTLGLAAGAAADPAGNQSVAAVDLTRTIDTSAPQPSLTTAEQNPTLNQSFDVDVDFGEPVNGLDPSNVTVINGSVTSVTPVSAGRYTLAITAADNGPVTIALPTGATSDLAGNLNRGSDSLAITYDAAAPTPIIDSDQPSTTGQSSFDITVDFAEPVTGFDAADLTITGATAGSEVDLGEGRYRVPITAAGDGTVTISLSAEAATDGAGRLSLAADDFSIVIDSQGFNAVLSTNQPSPFSQATFDVLVAFGKPVTGFDGDDLVIVNGSAGVATPQGADGDFLVPITADGDGAVEITVPTGVATDAANRGNLPSATLFIEVDQTAPTPTLITTATSPTRSGQFDVVVDFGETVSGFDDADLNIDGGTAGQLRSFGNGLFLVPIQASVDGVVTVSIDGGVASDAASNPNLAAATLSITVDRTSPQATLTSDEPSPTASESFELAIDFGQTVTDFALEDLHVDGGTARDLVDVGDGAFSVTIDVTSKVSVRVDLAAGLAQDLAGNPNQASESFEIMIESTNPPLGDASLTFQSMQTDPADLSGPQPVSWVLQRSSLRDLVITFDSPRTAVTAADLVLTNLGVNAPAETDVVIPMSDSQIELSGDGLQATIRFPADQMPDGVYQLELLPSLTLGDAIIISGNSQNRFYVLTGDWNGSGGVNIQDFATFAYWFGKSVPIAPQYADINGSGGVNIQDFAGLAGNFGKTITFPAAPASLTAGEGELDALTLIDQVSRQAVVEPARARTAIVSQFIISDADGPFASLDETTPQTITDSKPNRLIVSTAPVDAATIADKPEYDGEDSQTETRVSGSTEAIDAAIKMMWADLAE